MRGSPQGSPFCQAAAAQGERIPARPAPGRIGVGDAGGGTLMKSEKRKAGRKSIDLSSAGKVLFPGAGITRRDLAGYYRGVDGQMLPMLRARRVSLNCCAGGTGGRGLV